MKNRKTYYLIWILIIGFFTNSCVEPFDIQTEIFESAIVIEGTITNEFKYQKIKLTRTFRFEEALPLAESNADVIIIDDSQNTYNFEESIFVGNYISVSKFSAQPNTTYQLQITTNDGRLYSSEPTQLTNNIEIDDVYAVREISDLGVDHMAIFVDSFDPTGKSIYYRYEYEETYKIIAPFWSNKDVISTFPPLSFDVIQRTQQDRLCYNTVYSNTIIQTQTNGFTEDRVTRFPVRIISRDNFIISYRYSILVKQYVQSLTAHTFYRILNDLSSSESLLSQNQPGFLEGNVFSVENSNEKVLGFFEVTSVSSKRIFFNYEDFYPNEPLPPHIVSCGLVAPKIKTITCDHPLFRAVSERTHTFWNINRGELLGGPYLMVPAKCGDCTTLGEIAVPDFWIE